MCFATATLGVDFDAFLRISPLCETGPPGANARELRHSLPGHVVL